MADAATPAETASVRPASISKEKGAEGFATSAAPLTDLISFRPRAWSSFAVASPFPSAARADVLLTSFFFASLVRCLFSFPGVVPAGDRVSFSSQLIFSLFL